MAVRDEFGPILTAAARHGNPAQGGEVDNTVPDRQFQSALLPGAKGHYGSEPREMPDIKLE
jgi:hypothetical protein